MNEKYPLPADEAERQRSVERLDLTDTPAEERFDRLTRLATKLFNAPFSMLTLLDNDRQWFKSAQGHIIIETPRAESFCKLTVMGDGPLVIEDASLDQRFFDMPAVFDMGIKFYAGVPILSPDRKKIGTFCILDFESRKPDYESINCLQDLAKCAESELRLLSFIKAERELLSEMDELRRKASVDPVTRAWNSETIRTLLSKIRKENPGTGSSGLALLSLRLSNLAEVNEAFGLEFGDNLLREVAARIRSVMPEEACLGRLRATDFLVILPQLQASRAESVGRIFLDRVGSLPFKSGGRILDISVHGGLCFQTNLSESNEALISSLGQVVSQAATGKPGSLKRRI